MISALLELVHVMIGISTVAILDQIVRTHLPGSIEDLPPTASRMRRSAYVFGILPNYLVLFDGTLL